MSLPTYSDGNIQVSGLRIRYRILGKPDKGTVLVLNGGPGCPLEYLAPMADLALHGYRVVWYDQRGCGRSDRPRGRRYYTMELMADEADGIRRRLRLGKVDLFGHSFGGELAMQTALQHPAGIRTLIVASGLSSDRIRVEDVHRRLRQMTRKSRSAILHGARVRDGSSKAYESAWEEFERKFGFGMEIVPFELRQSLSRFAMGPIRAMFGATAEYPTLPAQGTYKGWDITSKLSTLRMPTLVLAGELDGSGPDASRVIHRSISGSWLVLMPGTGHTGFYQRREEYMQILRDFLDSTRTRKPRVARSGARRRSVSRARDGHWPDPVLRARPVDRESSVGAIDIAPTTPREWSEPAETREHTD